MSYLKKYIIITPCVTNMGGAQMYIRNKYTYMQKKGWDVDIITAQKGHIYISDLQKFNFVIPELNFNVYLYPKSKREKILRTITERIITHPYDEIIIESTCGSESTWAEVLAKKIGAKHLFYNLQEQDSYQSKNMQDFLCFKYDRRELAGINAKSLYNFFLPFHPISEEQSYYLLAYCNNVEEDISSPLLDKIDTSKYNHIIGCLTRLDKPFVESALNDFISYVNTNSEKKYLLLLIGGAPEESSYVQNIQNMFKAIHNVDLIITGYIFPVPIKLLDICNAFFTSAGSARVCMRSGIPTISYDANDYRPIGILGRTTNNSLMRAENEPIQDFSKLMDDILERNIYAKEPRTNIPNEPDFSSHDEFLASMSKENAYYNFDRVPLDHSERKLSMALRLIGAENYAKLGVIKKRLLTKFKR